jgi:uncharacterized protein YidB (DUF937 family)
MLDMSSSHPATEARMSQFDDLLGGLLGGKGGGGGGLDDLLGQLTGGQGGSTLGTRAGAGGGAGVLAALLPLIARFLSNGGLNKILAGFQQKGMTSQAASWVGTGDNEAVSGAAVEEVVGADEIRAIAEQLGISEQQAADAVAEVLPRVVDQVSPEGELPAEADLDDLFAKISGTASG